MLFFTPTTQSCSNCRTFRSLLIGLAACLSWLVPSFCNIAFTQNTLNRQLIFEKIGRQNTNVFLEDSYGFIWIGGNRLSRFNGHTIKTYQPIIRDSTQFPMGTINALLEDSQQRIWIGARQGLFWYDRHTDELTAFPLGEPGWARGGELVESLFEDSRQRLWIGGRERLFLKRSPDSDTIQMVGPIDLGIFRGQGLMGFTSIIEAVTGEIFVTTNRGLWLINEDLSAEQLLPGTWKNRVGEFQVFNATSTGNHILWLATNDGLWTFDVQQRSFKQMDLPIQAGKVLLTVLAGTAQDIWIGTQGNGLFRWIDDQFRHFPHDADNPFSPNDDRIKALMIDGFDRLWIGTIPGVQRITLGKEMFPFYQIDPGPYRHDNYFFRLMQDSSDSYWFRLLRQGLGYSAGLGKPVEILLQPDANSKGEEIKHFCSDADGNVWVLTLTNGLYLFEKGQTSYRQLDLGDSLRVAYAYAIRADRLDQRYLWFSSKFGLCRLNRHTMQRKWFAPADHFDLAVENGIGAFDQSEDGKIWMQFRHKGRKLIGYFDPKVERFVALQRHPGYSGSVKNNRTIHVKAMPGNKVWIAMEHTLITIDASKETVSFPSQSEHFPLGVVQGMIADLNGNIWLADRYQICKFDGTQYQCHDGRNDIEQFMYFSVSRAADGRLTFGGTNGLYSFYPSEIRFETDSTFPKVFLMNCQILNEKRHFGKAYELLEQIELPFSENGISFDFAALHPGRGGDLQYQHKLEPYEMDWIRSGSEQHQAVYTNLPPGQYTFKVIAAGSNEVWTPETEALTIRLRILPPWFQTWWAWMLWLTLLVTTISLLYRFQLNRRLAEAEAHRLIELDQFKTRLYENLTHEFRTPLTVILGLADQAVNAPSEWLEDGMQTIKRNGRRLLSLINQMLDLSKLEAGKLSLHMVNDDIIRYLSYIHECFDSYAELKGLNLHFLSAERSYVMDFDPQKLSDIVANLLSNALKFTPEGGNIYLQIQEIKEKEQLYLEIKVTDTGIGMEEKEIDQIFSRFYRIDDADTRSAGGSGIGLALTKELVALLNGHMKVESAVEKGSSFIVWLPVNQEMEKPVNPQELLLEEFGFPAVDGTKTENPTKIIQENINLPHLLIIEDNQDVVNYLVSCLNQEYHLIIASNGQIGIEKAIDHIPDIIISDIMMPVKSGFEVCNTLKKDERTSHIPIILLTAKANLSSRIEGLERGADAYLAKPFNEEELKVRLSKLIELRQALQKHYTRFINKETEKEVTPSPEDAFIMRVRELVEINIAEADYGTYRLCRDLGIGRSQLYRKLKALTGRSTALFVRSIRLQKAKELLLTTHLNVSEIAYDVGFTNPAYFTKVFSEEFGKSPTKFREA